MCRAECRQAFCIACLDGATPHSCTHGTLRPKAENRPRQVRLFPNDDLHASLASLANLPTCQPSANLPALSLARNPLERARRAYSWTMCCCLTAVDSTGPRDFVRRTMAKRRMVILSWHKLGGRGIPPGEGSSAAGLFFYAKRIGTEGRLWMPFAAPCANGLTRQGPFADTVPLTRNIMRRTVGFLVRVSLLVLLGETGGFTHYYIVCITSNCRWHLPLGQLVCASSPSRRSGSRLH